MRSQAGPIEVGEHSLQSGRRPLLLLDVDGVIHVLGPKPTAGSLRSDILISATTPEFIARLAEMFEPIWATSWEDEANEVIAPILGIPPLPIIRFDIDVPIGISYKLPPVQKFVAGCPFAWVDDDIGADAHAWIKDRKEPSLLIEVDPRFGILEAEVEELLAFAKRVSG